MLKDEPNDVFLRYSLAQECWNEDESEKALELLEALTRETPPYVPAFFRSAQFLAEDEDDAERVQQARDRLRNGIEEARNQGDHHAAAEMSEFLADLGRLGE